MGYNENALNRAIEDARDDYDWEITYRQVGEQEIGRGHNLYIYEVYVDGQYAEDEAADFFKNYGFYGVYTERTDYSYATLTIEIDSY